MNKIWINMGFWMLIVYMSCAISKKENERMDKLLSQQATPPEIKIADTLTADMLPNYEVRAVQKLEEFYDYLYLLSNDAYDKTMKSEIRTSAMGLFYDLDKSIIPLDATDGEGKPVEMFLLDQQESAADSDLSISSVEIITPLQLSATDRYDGQLSFQLSIGKEGHQKNLSKSAAFSLRKIEKTIGTESIKIWEVFLERIE
jgi:hypothetical protein